MTRALLVLLLVGCGGGAKSLRLPSAIPAVGQQLVVDERMTTRSELHGDGAVTERRKVWHRRSHRKTLVVEGSLVVRWSVRFEVDETTSIDSDGNESKVQGPLAGRSYEVWRDGDALDAKHADRSPVTAEERSALEKAFRSTGTTSRFKMYLLERAWRRGEVVELPRDVVDEMPLGDEADVQHATISWISLDGSVATFRVTLTYETAAGAEIQMTIDGRIDRTTGDEVGTGYQAIARGTTKGFAWVEHVEAVTTYEAE